MESLSINDSWKLIYIAMTRSALDKDFLRNLEYLKNLFRDIEALKLCLAGKEELNMAKELAALGLYRAEEIADLQAQKIFTKAIYQLSSPTEPQYRIAKTRFS
jgi:hypothetical protein